MTMTPEQKVEHQIQIFMQSKMERDRAQETMDSAKESIAEYFKSTEDSVLRIAFNEAFDIKATYKETSSKKLDKDKMADDLEVAKDKINSAFLIKATEDRKMSFEKFQDYYYNEPSDRVSIRLVAAEGGN